MIGRYLYSALSRTQKKILFVSLDVVFLPIALWSSYALRFSDWWPMERMAPFWWMFILIPLVGIYIFARLGLYRAVVRFFGEQAILAVIKGVAFLSLILYGVAHLSGITSFPRSIPINFAIIATMYVAGSRYLVKVFYQNYINSYSGKEAVIIYGVGEAGTQLSMSMNKSREFNPVAFVDDDTSLHKQIVNGLAVYSPAEIHELIQRLNIKRVVLAVPAASRARRKQIIDMLTPFEVRVQTLPSLAELASGTSSFEQLREVDLDNLLGRDVVPPNETLLTGAIAGKVVMVTGAGGSIGAEICRQVAKLSPQLLIMYDIGEFSLYSIEMELRNSNAKSNSAPKLVAILGSVLDEVRVESVISKYGVQTIFHAAAYKHVPLVEHNVLVGARNNIFGTKTVAEVASNNAVERFILISTDKAVRPTNVMGATKRVAEIVIQSLARGSESTIFSMVRFGNVLGSSGSVVPLFRKQIESGENVTVTHKDISRYFMSIPEAAQLVIQAGTMAKGGEVFVLDMGDAVKIYDLARNMIELYGLEVKDDANPDGDILIEITGLRPGEKLHEELLISTNIERTEHARILKANEKQIDDVLLEKALAQMDAEIVNNDPNNLRMILCDIVTDYEPHTEIVDYLSGAQDSARIPSV